MFSKGDVDVDVVFPVSSGEGLSGGGGVLTERVLQQR